MTLAGQVAVVTGGAPGIGEAISVRLRQEGATVAVLDLNVEAARSTADVAGRGLAIGTDVSMGFEYRPWLSNNLIVKFGASSLVPSQGFYDLYNGLRNAVNPLVAVFADVALTY